MLDRWANRFVHPTMEDIADYVPQNISANTITLVGFGIGLIAVPLLWLKLYSAALVVILLNRFFDGLDGAVARRNGITSLGGYLDITCDFIFYSAVILGFALANPEKNSLAATFLVFAFMGTGSSFLALQLLRKNRVFPQRHMDRRRFIIWVDWQKAQKQSYFISSFVCFRSTFQHWPLFSEVFAGSQLSAVLVRHIIYYAEMNFPETEF